MTFIGAFVNITLIVKLLENLLNSLFVIIICCSYKVVIGCIKIVADILDFSGNFVYMLFRGNSGFLCLFFNFLSVLICARAEEYIVAL